MFQPAGPLTRRVTVEYFREWVHAITRRALSSLDWTVLHPWILPVPASAPNIDRSTARQLDNSAEAGRVDSRIGG